MKKLILLTGFFIFTGLMGCGQKQVDPPADLITEADARQIALQKAGLETATFTKQEYDAMDTDYEFEFVTDTQKFECEISALDGTIKDYSVEERYDR